MSDQIDQIMERASQALARMDYLACETLCVQALAAARQQRDWDSYARIILPLQEARRQRRMIAADAGVRLGTSDVPGDAAALLKTIDSGCIVLTHPFSAKDAAALQDEVRKQGRHIEVLFADNAADAATWTLQSFRGVDVSLTTPAPPKAWHDRWLTLSAQRTLAAAVTLPSVRPEDAAATTIATPTDWFLAAMEALGDAAMMQIDASLRGKARLDAVAACLDAVTDHEILHQRLAETARQMHSEQ